MIIVIQCAASKNSEAGYFQRVDGKNVMFVSDPEKAPVDPSSIYVRPDDMAGTGRSWREELIHYNRKEENNPFWIVTCK